MVTSALSQSQYQVRFDWGLDGARTIAPGVDVFVIVDVLASGASPDFAVGLADQQAVVVVGSLRNAAAVARWALERQGDKGDRFTVAVVAAGELRDDGSLRFALEDFLGAGAVIDALADLGIDYCAPEAAAAAASFTGLRNATGHLIGASASGRQRTEVSGRADIDFAIAVNTDDSVPVLREFEIGD
jgi:2-phosphosulfolactate phosphatase